MTMHTWCVSGSSPRMRGAQPPTARKVVAEGIIPAYAGSTASRPPATSLRRDHPRVCGEHRGPLLYSVAALGSSPRMRGAPTSISYTTSSSRIIPAYAGSTVCPSCGHRYNGDHPRVCGEHAKPCDCRRPASGSSPRMRGAPVPRGVRRGNGGIIPAYAGSTPGSRAYAKKLGIIPAYAGSTTFQGK